MKALANLNNVEKAQLLHNLFPQEIPAVLQFISSCAKTLIEEQEQQRPHWDGALFGFDFWLSLAQHAEKVISEYDRKLQKSSRLFADELFGGYNAAFAVHCLTIYTTVRQHTNSKFTLATDLLFNP